MLKTVPSSTAGLPRVPHHHQPATSNATSAGSARCVATPGGIVLIPGSVTREGNSEVNSPSLILLRLRSFLRQPNRLHAWTSESVDGRQCCLAIEVRNDGVLTAGSGVNDYSVCAHGGSLECDEVHRAIISNAQHCGTPDECRSHEVSIQRHIAPNAEGAAVRATAEQLDVLTYPYLGPAIIAEWRRPLRALRQRQRVAAAPALRHPIRLRSGFSAPIAPNQARDRVALARSARHAILQRPKGEGYQLLARRMR